LGLRVVSVPALAGVHLPIMQSSANPSGGDDPAELSEVDPRILSGVDLVVDGGRLPGLASTVLDLRGYEADGSWTVVRAGPISEAVITLAVAAPFHFNPGTYGDDVVHAVHDYEALQARAVGELVGLGGAGGLDGAGGAGGAGGSSGSRPRRILALGVGTGATTRRTLSALPDAHVVGVDASPAMLAAASRSLADFGERFTARVAALQEPLPEGGFDAVLSALTVHHLDDAEKAQLFSRVRRALPESGVFVLADVVRLESEALAGSGREPSAGSGREPLAGSGASDAVNLTDGYDKPSPAADQVRWLLEAGFTAAEVVWSQADLAVIVARV